MSDFDARRNIERFLAPAYKEFEQLLTREYGEWHAPDRLVAVRQFCRFLQDGERPKKHYIPAPPRP